MQNMKATKYAPNKITKQKTTKRIKKLDKQYSRKKEFKVMVIKIFINLGDWKNTVRILTKR